MRVDETAVPALLAVFGLFAILIAAGEAAVATVLPYSLDTTWVAGIVMSIPGAVGVVYGGYYLERSQITVDRYQRVLCWCLGGVGFFLFFNVVTMIVLPPADALQLVSWLRWGVALGAGAGLTVGLVEARAVQREVSNERATVQAEEAETREELLGYLNATLRHEVLNSASAILAHVDLIRTKHDVDPGVAKKAAVIERQAQGMTTVIEDVRVLLQASAADNGNQPTDVTELLAAQATEVSERYSAVTVEHSLPGQAIVPADQLLERAFAHVLHNAVEYNDADAHISVTVERTDETVTIEMTDNGPGISEAEREHLFERKVRDDANHGLGLALAETLVESYGGTIELAETGPEGTTFRIELPRMTEAVDPARVVEATAQESPAP